MSGLVAIENARIWVGSGAEPFTGAVLIEGEHINAVTEASKAKRKFLTVPATSTRRADFCCPA